MTTQNSQVPAVLDRLLSPQEVARWLEVRVATLATWRSLKRYSLRYVKVGRLVRYRRSDVEAFLRARSTTTRVEVRP